MQDNFIIILIIFFVLVLVVLVFILKKLSDNYKDDNVQNEQLIMLGELLKSVKQDLAVEIKDTRRELDYKINSGQKDVSDSMKYQSESSHKLISEIFEHLSRVNQSVIEVKEGSRQVMSMATQLSNLEKVLTNQKQRGSWGESALELVLSNFLPIGVYKMQYAFLNGTIVDAVICVRDKILCIDSKFSIDNYIRSIDADTQDKKTFFAEEFKKDIKKRIEETSKYIDEVGENTLPFAFMFIPSEAIYYDINAGESGSLKINTNKLLEFAQSKKVIMVSPTSILAYLHLVMSGIKDLNIQKNTLEIKKKVEELGKHIVKYEEYVQKLGASLNTTVNHYNNSYKELKKIDKDIYKITDGNSEHIADPILIDRVNAEDVYNT